MTRIFALEEVVAKVSISCMNAAVANENIPEVGAEMIHQMVKGQVETWFAWMDRMLDVHRSTFVFREASAAQLKEHKLAFDRAIRYSLLMNALIEGPDFNEPGLVSRLRVRIQQLKDAYATFHDPDLTDEKAERILRGAFPE
jgi:hypothetical protein